MVATKAAYPCTTNHTPTTPDTTDYLLLDRLVGLVVKTSASRAEDAGFELNLRWNFFRGRIIPVTEKLALQAPGVIRSALGLVGPVSVYCDWVRWNVWSATSISVWQHLKLSEQIPPWDTLACRWNVKQASKQPTTNLLLLLLLQRSQLYLWGSPFLVRFLRMWPFQSKHWGNIPSSWMVHAGCVFVSSIYPSRTWMSGSFESVRWNACVHRLDLGLYSHPKELLGNGVRADVNSKGKIPSTGGSRESRTCDAASRRTASPTHYRLSYSGPPPTVSLPYQHTKLWCLEVAAKVIIVWWWHRDTQPE